MNEPIEESNDMEETPISTITFEDKRKMLFESLNSAEMNIIKGTSLEQKNLSTNALKRTYCGEGGAHPSLGRKFQGKDSIFKKPSLSITKCLQPRRTPDYQVNPHKWTKYTLMDTDISDRTNTAGALDFLKEIEERKRLSNADNANDDGDVNDDESSESTTKIVKFKKRSKSTAAINELSKSAISADTAENEKVTFKGTKIVMAEYVIGGKNSATKERKSVASLYTKKKDSAGGGDDKLGKPLKLGHLFEDDEEEEEE